MIHFKTKFHSFFYIILLLVCSFVSSCGGSKTLLEEQVININKKQTQDNISFFFTTMSAMTVNVFYEEEAKPYAGSSESGLETWSLTEANLKKVFGIREQEMKLTVPKELEDMTKLEIESKDNWSSAEIVELSSTLLHKDKVIEEKVGFFTIIFLNGYFRDGDDQENQNVIAVSLNGTNVIGVFKPVIENMADGKDRLGRFVEQSTIIHEMGHALGLVNNGVGLTSPHHDEEHGAHCSNEDCVMYWQNEGRANLISFVQKVLIDGNTTLFGDECLEDFKSH
ncbi:hypothetical protein OAT67_02920 [Bacteriovoracaceae bacterium]|nr:hypothetical protein [Bacteriovoracaceae bacterium]